MSITASDACKRLLPLIQEVNNDASAIEIVSKNGTAFLMSEAGVFENREVITDLARGGAGLRPRFAAGSGVEPKQEGAGSPRRAQRRADEASLRWPRR